MAGFTLVNFILLSFATGGLTLAINDILGFGYTRLAKPEEPRVVELVRWRQSVCITPAPGIQPCPFGSNNVHQSSEVDDDDEHLKILSDDDSLHDSSSLESVDGETQNSPVKRSTRTSSLLKLYSPTVVKYVKLNNMGSSSFQSPVPEGTRRGRYLRLSPQLTKAANRRQTVYEVKVVDSPVIAHLVAEVCLPNIGVPLCDEQLDAQLNPGNGGTLDYRKPSEQKPIFTDGKPPLSISIVSDGTTNQQINTQSSNKPSGTQIITDYLNRPTVMQTNDDPKVKPVIVVQPTSPPGLFAGINALLAPNNNNWFNVFYNPLANKPDTSNNAGLVGGNPLIPGLLQIPAIPSIQEILYRPENDISENQGILGFLTNSQSKPPGVGPATEKPGIFGGLFASPINPLNFDGLAPSQSSPSLLGGLGNIFGPTTNRPLVIEKPNEKPIIVEKPIYVVEQPLAPALLDILQIGNKPVRLNDTDASQVIKDPVYVLQKPTESPPLFGVGLFPNWNIFNRPDVSSTIVDTTKPEVVNDKNPVETEPIVVITNTVSSHEPVIHPIDQGIPAFPEKPAATPGVVDVSSAGFATVDNSAHNSESAAVAVAASSASNSQGSSESVAIAVASSTNENSTPFKESSNDLNAEKEEEKIEIDIRGKPVIGEN